MILTASFIPSTVSVTVYGLPGEKIIFAPISGDTITVTIPGITDGVTKNFAPGSYIVTGDLSGVSKVITIDGTVNSFRTGQAYFWDGASVTGGFSASGYTGLRTIGGSASVGTTLSVSAGSTNYRDCYVGSVNAHDITNISTVKFQVTGGWTFGNTCVGISTDKSVQPQAGSDSTLKAVQPSTGTVSIDTSSLTGNWYFYLGAYRYDYYSGGVTVSRIWGVC